MNPEEDRRGSEVSNDMLWSLRAVFWVVPLYALTVGLYAVALGLSNSDGLSGILRHFRAPVMMKFAVVATALFFAGLAGVAVRSVQCALTIKDDPFRAFAMGRYILVLFMVVSMPLTLWDNMPRSKVEAPLAAVLQADDQVAALDVSQCQVYEAGFFQWLAFLANSACEFFQILSIVLFAFATYKVLSRDRQHYDLDNFIFDITFGWKGVEYGTARPPADRQSSS
jgi:hypothetical protein